MPNRIHLLDHRLSELESSFNEASIEEIHHPVVEKSDIKLWIKREDQLHPIISGNKWRKLKYILNHALVNEYDHLISMGGAWSNHLHALAWVGKELGLKTTGIIRGERPKEESSTLKDIKQWGMQLKFISRSEFRQLRMYHDHDSPPAKKYHGYWIPEGGANQLALKGVSELVDEINIPFDTIVLACGTGTTLAGVASVLPCDKTAIGFAALKGASFLNKEVSGLLGNKNSNNWSINLDYHFGGFAKSNQNLNFFMEDYEKQTGIPLEPVYTGKMMYGLFDLIKRGMFNSGQNIISIHTGGLQGKSGFQA